MKTNFDLTPHLCFFMPSKCCLNFELRVGLRDRTACALKRRRRKLDNFLHPLSVGDILSRYEELTEQIPLHSHLVFLSYAVFAGKLGCWTPGAVLTKSRGGHADPRGQLPGGPTKTSLLFSPDHTSVLSV